MHAPPSLLIRWLGWRLFGTLPIIVAAVLFTFLLTRWLPGDPAAFLASGNATPQEIAALRTRLGLDDSLAVQLLHYLAALAQGDWGQSHVTGQAVASDLLERLPASLELTLSAFVLTLACGIPLGMAAALHPGSGWDRWCRTLSTLGTCLPAFVVGVLLLYVFYVVLGWAPEPIGQLDVFIAPPPRLTGSVVVDSLWASSGGALRSALGHLALPSVTMALFGMAPLARATRAALLAALSSEPVRTARALGLRDRVVLWHYALRLAALPIVTTAGMVLSTLLGANVVVEKVFAWPGVGSYALDALMAADYAPLQGFVLLVAMLFAVINLGVDLLAAFIDPRTLEAA